MTKVNFTNDRIADSLTRIRNAALSNKNVVKLPNVKIVLELLKVLANNNLIGSYSINEAGEVEVNLKVENDYKFTSLKRISKPGVRRYIGVNEIRPVKGGRGIAVLSTSHGIISNKEARKHGVGGELLCEIW